MKGCGQTIGPFDCCTVVVGDCLDVMEQIPDGSVDLFFADPPYNKGKADWDKDHDWRTWIPEAARVLKDNGAFWAIHRDARELAKLSGFIEDQDGPPFVNWITWDLFNGNEAQQALGGPLIGATMASGLRSFQQMAEYLIYHAVDPMMIHLQEARMAKKLNFNDVDIACGRLLKDQQKYPGRGTRLYYRWEHGDCLPTKEQYRELAQVLSMSLAYEDLRYTFNNPGGISSIWQGRIARRSGHPTPKPEWLLERIIEATSNPGDLVADFFMGGGTTAVAAQKLGRHFFGCDTEAEYVAITEQRLNTVQLAMQL